MDPGDFAPPSVEGNETVPEGRKIEESLDESKPTKIPLEVPRYVGHQMDEITENFKPKEKEAETLNNMYNEDIQTEVINQRSEKSIQTEVINQRSEKPIQTEVRGHRSEKSIQTEVRGAFHARPNYGLAYQAQTGDNTDQQAASSIHCNQHPR